MGDCRLRSLVLPGEDLALEELIASGLYMPPAFPVGAAALASGSYAPRRQWLPVYKALLHIHCHLNLDPSP